MSGAKSKKVTGKPKNDRTNEKSMNNGKSTAERMEANHEEDGLTTAKAIQNLTKSIHDMKSELKQELTDFKNDFRNYIIQEFNNFRMEINQKLTDVGGDVTTHGTRLTEAEERVDELETANTELKDTLLCALKQQKTLQAKLTDMEGHSRYNNIRIYGLKEGTEGTSMLPFITNFLTTQLDLGEDVDLQIQRAHRSLGPKP